ncbi:MAG: caspase family protein, partial [Candidatus Competibacteraceae bacterium]|nr:caspase family protein [Candidatus Competibacteraceae bacterium]
MKSSAKYWLYALLISTSVLADTSVIAGERHALLVGVSNYLNHGVGLNNLPGAVNDIESLVPVLQEQWGFSAANITRLTDQQATRENILQTLAKLAQKLAPGDHLLFYFSGHGTGPLDTS